jgi:hypothetical protein
VLAPALALRDVILRKGFPNRSSMLPETSNPKRRKTELGSVSSETGEQAGAEPVHPVLRCGLLTA